MAKLFAFEEMEIESPGENVEISDDELDSVQELPVVQDENEEIGEHAEAIDEAVDATGDLDEVREVVEKSIEEEGGLSPVAAEAVRIAVESICARVGASPKSLFSLYATENYKSSSARLANSKLALEGIGEFIRNLWEKIKKAVKSLWDKLVAFWEKHFSTLGRLSKTLNSLYDKVGSIKGKVEEKEVKAPSSLAKDYCWANPISAKVIKETLSRHIEFIKKLGDFRKITNENNELLKNIAEKYTTPEVYEKEKQLKSLLEEVNKLSFGGETEPLVTGVYYVVEAKEMKERTFKEYVSLFSIDKKVINKEVEDDVKFEVLTIEEMRELIKLGKEIVNKTMDMKKSIPDMKKSLNEVVDKMDKLVAKLESQENVNNEDKDMYRAIVGVFSKLQSSYAKFAADVVSLNTRAANSIIIAVKTSARMYKKS